MHIPLLGKDIAKFRLFNIAVQDLDA